MDALHPSCVWLPEICIIIKSILASIEVIIFSFLVFDMIVNVD